MNNIRTALLLITLLCCFPAWSAGDEVIYVIMNQSSGVTELGKKQVVSLFLGRARSFPNGQTAKPIDHQTDSSIRKSFFEGLTGKQISDIDAYWARLSYSGRAFPPKSLNNTEQVLQEVTNNKHAISYVKGKTKEALSEQSIVVVYTIEGR